MAMPRVRVRLKLWMLMTLVVMIALGMGLVRRRRDLLSRAESHRRHAELYRLMIAVSETLHPLQFEDLLDLNKPSTVQEVRRAESDRKEEWSRLADFHATLQAKYERAAHRPWLPVTSDPPEPD